MFFFKKIIYFKFLLIFLYFFSSSISFSVDVKSNSYGLSVYKKGNCMGCHSWHGKGGGGYGAGVSLRTSNLNFNDLIEIIKCGKPGSGMPYFYKKSYLEEKCYDTTFKDYDSSYRPVSSKRFLSSKQIEAVSIFVREVLQDKKLDKNYCEFFYEIGSKVCLNLKN